MMPEDMNEEELDKYINMLFEIAEKEKYDHSRSDEVFNAFPGLWFLSDSSQKALAKIASNYIVSSFLLKSLKYIYEKFSIEYNLPKIDAISIGDENKYRQFSQEINQTLENNSFRQWLENTLIPKCLEILENHDASNLEDVSRLGNLADSIENITEQYSHKDNGNLYIYDSIFMFSDQLLGATAESISIHFPFSNDSSLNPAYYSGNSEINKNDMTTIRVFDQTEEDATTLSLKTELISTHFPISNNLLNPVYLDNSEAYKISITSFQDIGQTAKHATNLSLSKVA